MLKFQKDNASLLDSAIKDFISLLIFMSTQLSLSRNVMNAHWKTQISKLLTLEVQHTMMNIIVLWYLHGITELQRSFWVSRHQTSWYCNWRRGFCSLSFARGWGDALYRKCFSIFIKRIEITVNIFLKWENYDTMCEDTSGGGYFWAS